MFEIRDRACKVGNHVNARTQRHGVEEVVTALDFTITLPLERDEINSLTNDAEGYDRMFRQEDGGRLEPAFKSVRPLQDQIESARVEVAMNGGKSLVLGDCKVSKIRFEPKTKGGCDVRSQIQCAPKLDVGVVTLLRNLGSDEAHISIRAQNEQQPLSLPPAADEKPRRGRKPKAGQTKAPSSSPAKRGRTRKNSNGAATPAPAAA